MQTVNFLIELGFEEIPSGLIGSVVSQLEVNFSQALEDNSISCKKMCSYASPVRVVLSGEISYQNSPRQTEVKGPSYGSAYDKQGNLTAAARGFLKSQGVEESDVFIQDTEKGKYFSVRKREQSKLSSQVIKDILPGVISKVSLPKYMSWDNSGLKFTRPLRSVLVICKDNVLKFKLANLESSSSVSVRDGAVYKQFKVKTVKGYFALIKKEGIILSLSERKNKISSTLNKEASKFHAGVALNDQLLEEVANIVERPAVVCCDFESKFLKLPEIVLLASMAKYQRVFALYGGNKKIINKFLAVVENRPANAAGIKKHYEFVLNARLQDAEFFFYEDTKEPLDKNLEKLKGIILHKQLGDLLAKTQNMMIIANHIALALGFSSGENKNLIRAAELSKTDLLTKMVYEFPSLEGAMGSVYAKLKGEDSEVIDALAEHYKPRSNEDRLPKTELGALLSLIDKAYNIIGLLGIGVIPSGSVDPFTIRRQVQAVIRILIDYRLELSIRRIFDICYGPMQGILSQKKEDILKIFLTLSKERFCYLMREENIPQDLITASAEVNFDIPYEVFLRIKMLNSIYRSEELFCAAKVAERSANIIKTEASFDVSSFKENLLHENEEKKLYQAYLKNKDIITEKIQNRQYDQAVALYSGAFYDIMHEFFDKVLVNVEDNNLRNNRKLLLYLIHRLLTEKVLNPKEMEVLKNAGDAREKGKG